MSDQFIELYHGSTVTVREPRILVPGRTLDFGRGFYTTSSFAQARKWALNKKRNENAAAAVVSVYHVPGDHLQLDWLKVKDFTLADSEWLDFVMANRTDITFTHDYDIVKGAVANDRVYASINAFANGFIDRDTLLKELRTWVFVDQIVFHTGRALSIVRFVREEEVG